MLRSRILVFCLIPLVVWGVFACGETPPASPFHALVLTQTAVDDTTGQHTFALAPAVLSGVEDFEALAGPSFEVLRGGVLRIERVSGSVVLSGGFENGRPPDLRYAVESDVAIPRDYPTLAMLSAAHVFGDLLDRLADFTGVTPERLVQRFGSLQIFFEPKVEFVGEGTITQKFNAFFAPAFGDFGLARRSDVESTPLAADPKVLAHELGHALFALLVSAPEGAADGDDSSMPADGMEAVVSRRFAEEYVLRGFNEGFGDFNAFVFTGSVDVLANQAFVRARSGDARSLRGAPFRFPELARAAIEGASPPCARGIYCLGTLLARALFATYLELGHAPDDAGARAAFGRSIFTALAGTRRVLVERGFGAIEPDGLDAILDRDLLVPAWDGPVSGAFLSALLEGVPVELQLRLCAAFADMFGDEGFPRRFRTGCASS